MTDISLCSERVQAAGGFQGGGIVKLLGAPRMDDLTILVREAVQNSWDARFPADTLGTVDFHFRISNLERAQSAALRELFRERPAGGSNLGVVLDQDPVLVAEIRDEGTKGLNGPTRADRAVTGDRNFIDFIRNIAAPQDREESGGTYGFGKGSYYRASSARTILVHTRCRDGGRVRSRFIAAAVGEPFDDGESQFTGRHFWGVPSDDGEFVEPVEGTEADVIARNIGFGVSGDSTGTSILILGFEPGLADAVDDDAMERNPQDAARHVAHQIAWQCWPKLVDRQGVTPMSFHVSYEDEEVIVPGTDGVSEAPALNALMKTLRGIHDEHDSVEEIRSLRPKALLGHLDFSVFQAENPMAGFGTEDVSGFTVPTHHVALLRAPELVVKYLKGPESDLSDHGWVGVFLADSAVDPSFAASEPPTHDDWVPKQVSDPTQKRHVKIALDRVREQVKDRFAPKVRETTASDVPVAEFAAKLGDAFRTPGTGSIQPAGDGTGAGNGGSTGASKTHRIRQGRSRFDIVDGTPAHVIDLDSDGASRAGAMHASVGVAVDDGNSEQGAPLGAAVPSVLGWFVDGRFVVDGPVLEPVPSGETYEVAIEHLAGVASTLTVTDRGTED